MDRAIALLAQQAADELQWWRRVRDDIRSAIEEQGFDAIWVRSFRRSTATAITAAIAIGACVNALARSR